MGFLVRDPVPGVYYASGGYVRSFFYIGIYAAALSVLCLTGCENDSSSPSPNPEDGAVALPIPNLAGEWGGVYYETDDPQASRHSIRAAVTQSGGSITIATTKAGGAWSFSGTIEGGGEMEVVNAADDETWTTYYGPATEQAFVIADFLWTSEDGTNSPLSVIELSR